MKIIDLLFSDTANLTVLQYIVFSQGFSSGFVSKDNESESSLSIRLGGVKTICRGLLKYSAIQFLVNYVMVDMTNIEDRGHVFQSMHFYICGFFIYFQAGLIGKRAELTHRRLYPRIHSADICIENG
jgi:hypothetical protein